MKLIFSTIILLLTFTGCATQKPKPIASDIKNLKSASYKFDENKTLLLQKEYEKKDENGTVVEKKTIIEKVPSFAKPYKKSLSFKAKKKRDISIKGNKVKVCVEAIPLNEFVDLVFGSVLKLNYTLSEDVKKLKTPITLNMQQAQNAKQFYEVVKKILLLHAIQIKNQNGVLFISKSGKSVDSSFEDIYIGYGRELPKDIQNDKKVLLFVPYYYIKPGNTVNMLRTIGMNNIKFYYYINNLQTMFGKAEDIKKALKLIKLLDRPFLQGKKAYLLNLENIEIEKFINKMKQIFVMNGVNVTNTPSTGGITMLPIEDLNMLYVITPKEEWLDMLLYWKDKLDIPSQTSQEPGLYIYHVRNRKADELATAIKAVLGLSKTKIQKKQSLKKKNQKSKTLQKSQGFLISAANYTPTVTADKDTNILMLKLTPKDYRILLPFVEELDKLPLQTLVEVTVANVDMTDTFSLGFEYALRNQSANLVKDTLDITGGGSGLGIVFRGNYLDATINAFAQKQLLDIVSRPRILILNNNTGSINVGTQVPIITSETSATDTTAATPTINRNITYRTTGINLGLTPTINSNGVLTMNISIDLSEAQLNDTSGIDSPLIVNRTLNTVAVINSGDTILIGGLISENKSKTKGGVPFLKDIPYLGTIFSSVSNKTTKTELIMLIRPTIIKTRQEMSRETYKFKKILNVLETINL